MRRVRRAGATEVYREDKHSLAVANRERGPIRSSIDLMTIFVTLSDHELATTSVEMWSEVFTAWAVVHGRGDAESAAQLGEYEEFLRASIWHLKQLRDAPGSEPANEGKKRRAEKQGPK